MNIRDREPDQQFDSIVDIGLRGLIFIARYHSISADAAQIRHESGLHICAFGESELVLAARRIGLRAKAVDFNPARLTTTPLPALVFCHDGQHVVVLRSDGQSALIVMPGSPENVAPRVIALDALSAVATGRMLLAASRASLAAELAHFDFSWFIPAIVKYRRVLIEVLGVSLLIQIFGLVSPLMFQVVMDKVLVNHTSNTLNVVCVALFLASTFEVILTGLRTYVFSHTTNRIDVELGARLFRHLFSLPLGYFSVRRVGDTVARVRELENIRNFLTGQALTAVLDIMFSVIFIAVMCIYSVKLTLVVVASLPLYVAVSFGIVPLLRKRLSEKFSRGADNQSFLVESVSGIETVKSMAVEPQFITKWESQLASYVASGFRVTSLANIGQQMIQYIGKLVSLGSLLFGSHLVINGQLTIGELIAFNMMSQRVAAPVLRLAQLWQDFQQTGISMSRLGDILNCKTEKPVSRQAMPEVSGNIQFENIRFRYRPDGPPVLDGVSLEIRAGDVVGVVGRSGSGKSTLTKLLQRLYVAEQGAVRVDGIDLALADPAWLRRQIGVVLQENYLFNRTIRENIALVDPAAPLDRVINVARLAGAHDFICEMPEAYDTIVREHGASLSGGQRQRIALARALLSNPRILILDEATSALDFETEKIIHNNMKAICAGRTVIIIAHRLNAVRNASCIYALDRGRVVESGTHEELLARNSYYAKLVTLQNE